MNKIFTTLIFLLCFSFVNYVHASDFEVVSPSKGDVYKYGEEMNIEWTPKRIGIQTIQINSTDTSDGLVVYARKVYDYPTNYTGRFSFELPKHVFVRPGQYRLKFIAEDDSEYRSDVFTIESEQGSNTTVPKNPKYVLGEFVGAEKNYSVIDKINVSVPAYEAKGVNATPQNGFNVQAHLYKTGDRSSALRAINAEYNYTTKNWDINMIAPEKAGAYTIIASLYCGNLSQSSYCANKYGGSDQVEKEIKFKVSNASKKTIGLVYSGDRFISGNMQSPVKLLVFTDLNCPFCARFHDTLKQLASSYNNTLAVVYRNLPLTNMHPEAMNSAMFAECVANMQGTAGYERYIKSVFDYGAGIDKQILKKMAIDQGIGEEYLNTCVANNRFKEKIKQDIKSAKKILGKNAQGVPASMLFGPSGKKQIILGSQPLANMKGVIDDFLGIK